MWPKYGDLISPPYRCKYRYLSEYFQLLSDFGFDPGSIDCASLLLRKIPVSCVFSVMRLGGDPSKHVHFNTIAHRGFTTTLEEDVNAVKILLKLISTKTISRLGQVSGMRSMPLLGFYLLKSMLVSRWWGMVAENGNIGSAKFSRIIIVRMVS